MRPSHVFLSIGQYCRKVRQYAMHARALYTYIQLHTVALYQHITVERPPGPVLRCRNFLPFFLDRALREGAAGKQSQVFVEISAERKSMEKLLRNCRLLALSNTLNARN